MVMKAISEIHARLDTLSTKGRRAKGESKPSPASNQSTEARAPPPVQGREPPIQTEGGWARVARSGRKKGGGTGAAETPASTPVPTSKGGEAARAARAGVPHRAMSILVKTGGLSYVQMLTKI